MAYFPMCVDLQGKRILLVGQGTQIDEKAERLRPFGGDLCYVDALREADLTEAVAMVVIGDTPEPLAEEYSRLCQAHRIPVNVVDIPRLCTFCFSSIIQRGDLTISVSTGGAVPAVGVYLKRRIEEQLPTDVETILQELQDLRQTLYRQYPKETVRAMLREAVEKAFE